MENCCMYTTEYDFYVVLTICVTVFMAIFWICRAFSKWHKREIAKEVEESKVVISQLKAEVENIKMSEMQIDTIAKKLDDFVMKMEKKQEEIEKRETIQCQ